MKSRGEDAGFLPQRLTGAHNRRSVLFRDLPVRQRIVGTPSDRQTPPANSAGSEGETRRPSRKWSTWNVVSELPLVAKILNRAFFRVGFGKEGFTIKGVWITI